MSTFKLANAAFRTHDEDGDALVNPTTGEPQPEIRGEALFVGLNSRFFGRYAAKHNLSIEAAIEKMRASNGNETFPIDVRDAKGVVVMGLMSSAVALPTEFIPGEVIVCAMRQNGLNLLGRPIVTIEDSFAAQQAELKAAMATAPQDEEDEDEDEDDAIALAEALAAQMAAKAARTAAKAAKPAKAAKKA